jgi:type IX secretion system PorP/SprF family membrane protein
MRKIFKILFFLAIPFNVFGQFTPVTNQYILNPLTINPAYAGNRGVLNFAAFFRKQWVGIQGAPETMTLSLDAPFFDEKIGLGFIIVTDKIGVTKETQFITNYAYKIEVGKGNLSFGLGAGVNTTNTAWSDLVVLDQGDEFYLNNSRLYVVPNFSFGAYYTYNNHIAGFSIPRFLSYNFNLDKNRYSIKFDPGQYDFMLNYGYTVHFSQKVKFFPSTLLIVNSGQKLLYDINAYFNYADRFWAGVSYRNKRSFAGLFQFQVNNQLRIAYTYDFDIGKIGKYSNGSHEIMLRYEFRYKIDVANPLIF